MIVFLNDTGMTPGDDAGRRLGNSSHNLLLITFDARVLSHPGNGHFRILGSI
jgi:hypothetical protein